MVQKKKKIGPHHLSRREGRGMKLTYQEREGIFKKEFGGSLGKSMNAKQSPTYHINRELIPEAQGTGFMPLHLYRGPVMPWKSRQPDMC